MVHISTCLGTGDVSSMYHVDGKDAYANEYSCRDELGMYTLDDGDTRLCVTRQQCVARNRYVLNDSSGQPFKCLTGSECAQYEECYNDGGSPRPCYYAYSATGTCIREKPHDLDGFDLD